MKILEESLICGNMKTFTNILIILIGLFLFVCIIFMDFSRTMTGCLGVLGFICILLGWIAVND